MDTPLVSILVPVYNSAEYTAKCLGSLIAQTYQNIEVICVNDCSTDNSGAVLDEFAKQDTRVKPIHHKENTGGMRSIADAFAKSEGLFIAEIDGDDWVEPDYIEKLYTALISSNADASVCSTIFDQNGKEWKIEGDGEITEFAGKDALNSLIIPDETSFPIRGGGTLWAKLFTRPVFEQVDWEFSVKYRFDYMTLFQLYFYCEKVVYLNLGLIHYVNRETSMVNTNTNFKEYNKGVTFTQYSDAKKEWFKERGADISAELDAQTIGVCIDYINIAFDQKDGNQRLIFSDLRTQIANIWQANKNNRHILPSKRKAAQLAMLGYIPYKIGRKLFLKLQKSQLNNS